MRGWAAPAVFLVLLGSAAGGALADHEPKEVVEQPVFTLGDWWNYRLKGEISGTANSTVERRENITVNGTTWDTWRITADVAASQVRTPAFTDTFYEHKWVRVNDHARVRTHAESEDATQTTSYVPPQAEIVFPFDESSNWTRYSNVTREEERSVFGIGRPDPEGSVKHSYERIEGNVVGKVRMNTVAGQFITYLIEYGSHSREGERFYRWYYAPEVCTNVLEEFYLTETDLEPQIIYELMDFRCTRPAEPLEDTEDVQDEPPPPTWQLPDDVTPPDSGGKKSGGLPGFDPLLVLAAAALALALMARRRQG